MINSFRGKYYFLSNFSPCIIICGDFSYRTLESAYQSAKTKEKSEKLQILLCKTPGEAKQLGHKIKIRDDWEEVKFGIMRELLNQKFSKEPFKSWLIETGKEELIEGNNWHDLEFGRCYCKQCNGKGENRLGKMLMEIRKEIG